MLRNNSSFDLAVQELIKPSNTLNLHLQSAMGDRTPGRCPDCGTGLIRLGSCFSCPACGFGSCG